MVNADILEWPQYHPLCGAEKAHRTGQVGVTEVYGIRLLENTASGRVLEKCGFQTFFTGAGAYHGGVHEISKSVWKA